MVEEMGQESEPVSPNYLFGMLEGSWSGEGRGEFPTIASFNYRETLTFERRSETSLFYLQRTERLPEGQEPVTSHWESGFIDVLESGELQLANVQSGGRGEILVGEIEEDGDKIRLRFESTSLANDERMVATARVFKIEGDTLHYEMKMAMTQVGDLTLHVVATLRRVAR